MKSKLIIIAAAVILIVTVVLLYYCIPHEEVYGLINKNWFITFILIGIITLTLTGGSLLIYRSNRLKIRAQEEARQSMEKLGLQERIRESEMRYRAITERKKLEESFRESEEKYRTLVENLPDYVMRYDKQHRHIFANSRTFRDNNMTAEEFLGKTHQELGFDPHLCGLWEKAIDKAFETGQPQVEEFEWKDAFEVKRSFEWRVYPEKAKDGSIETLVGVSRDITDSKRAEEEIVMLANSLKIVNECVCITDMENNFQFVNELFSKTYGYNANELIGKHISLIRSSDTAPASVEEILSATIHGGWQGELCNKRKNGSEFPVYLSTSIINDKNNKHLGLIGVSTDITERKHTEEEMKVSKIQLEQLYSHLTDVRENERAGISREIHDELGQSLTALKMDLNWTKENVANKMLFDKKLNGMINIVTETIRKVQKISSDLRPGILDDLGLIPAIEWYCKEFEERTGLQCHLELKEIPALNSKIILTLFRIMQEGLTNIIRHANAKSVEVKLYSSLGRIFLKINDDGIGISKEKINSKDSIGLIGMKERLRQFNGTLEIFSSKNNGTGLIISIPIPN